MTMCLLIFRLIALVCNKTCEIQRIAWCHGDYLQLIIVWDLSKAFCLWRFEVCVTSLKNAYLRVACTTDDLWGKARAQGYGTIYNT